VNTHLSPLFFPKAGHTICCKLVAKNRAKKQLAKRAAAKKKNPVASAVGQD